MKIHSRLVLLGIALIALTLVGCSSRAFGGFPLDVQTVDTSDLVRTIQYLDDENIGPLYTLSLTVPEEWVGVFETTNVGNSIVFEYIIEPEEEDGFETRSPIFYIDALSNSQYWEQIGSYPGQYKNIINTGDTYMIYHLPIDAYYSGLTEEEFEAFAAIVPDIIASVETNRAEQ